jgi:hypothetical protein
MRGQRFRNRRIGGEGNKRREKKEDESERDDGDRKKIAMLLCRLYICMGEWRCNSTSS